MKKLTIAILAITAVSAANVEASYLWEKAKSAATKAKNAAVSAKNYVSDTYYSTKEKVRASETAQKLLDQTQALGKKALHITNEKLIKVYIPKAVEMGGAALVTLINLKRAEQGKDAISQNLANKLVKGVSKVAAAGTGLAVEKVGGAVIDVTTQKFRPIEETLTPEEQEELAESLEGLDLEEGQEDWVPEVPARTDLMLDKQGNWVPKLPARNRD